MPRSKECRPGVAGAEIASVSPISRKPPAVPRLKFERPTARACCSAGTVVVDADHEVDGGRCPPLADRVPVAEPVVRHREVGDVVAGGPGSMSNGRPCRCDTSTYLAASLISLAETRITW